MKIFLKNGISTKTRENDSTITTHNLNKSIKKYAKKKTHSFAKVTDEINSQLIYAKWHKIKYRFKEICIYFYE